MAACRVCVFTSKVLFTGLLRPALPCSSVDRVAGGDGLGGETGGVLAGGLGLKTGSTRIVTGSISIGLWDMAV